MGTRVKTFDNTGIATAGRLYAGDLNLIQDQYADQANLSQTVDVGTLRVGETGLQLLRYGAGEARISGMLRTDGYVMGLGGVMPGAFSTTARDAIPLGQRPTNLIIKNTTTGTMQYNVGSDAVPSWVDIALLGSPTFTGDPKAPTPSVNDNDTSIATTAFVRSEINSALVGYRYRPASASGNALESLVQGEANQRIVIDVSGGIFWGPGGASALEMNLARRATNRLRITSGSLEVDQDANGRFIGVGADGGAVRLDYDNASTKGQVLFAGLYYLRQSLNGSDVTLKSNASLASALELISRDGDSANQLSIGYSLGGSIEWGTSRDIRMYRVSAGKLELRNNYSAGYLVQFGFNTEIPSGSTGIASLRYHNGSGVVTGDVTVGAADSGGVGWRVLRVPN